MGANKVQNSKKRTYTRRKPTQKQLQEQEAKRQSFQDEIILWLMLAVCIILFVANFGFGGMVGGTVSSFFFGLMGVIAYIFPVCLFIGTVFVMSNRKNNIAIPKIIAFVLFVFFLCMLVQMFADPSKTATAASAFSYSMENKKGGGFVGGMLEYILCKFFGVVGAYVIDVVILIISLVLITERSLLNPVKKGGKAIYSGAKDEGERMRSAHLQRKEERKKEQARRRMEQVVTGVSQDTLLVEPDQMAEKTDEVSELKVTGEDLIQVGESRHVTLVAEGNKQHVTHAAPKEEKQLQVTPISSKSKSIRELAEAAAIPDVPVSEDPVEERVESIPVPPVSEPVAKKPEAPAKKITEEEISQEVAAVDQQAEQAMKNQSSYVFPPVNLLQKPDRSHGGDDSAYLNQTAEKLKETLKNFGVNITITAINRGPSVTRYEFQPEMGVKVSKIVSLADDIKLNLAAADIRIEAPIPGKAAIGIEVPNKQSVAVLFRELVESKEFRENKSPIAFAVGKDIAGRVMVADIAKMPHLLIAGATGSGKSVCINTIIMSIIYRAKPEDVKLIMIDPKVVELSVYNGIPHLMIPVVTDPKKAAGALNWAVAEMTERYQKFAEYGVRDLKGYNQKVESIADIPDEPKPVKLPQIVIIVDELADLMMVAPSDVEDAICRLAQLARACGIHLVIATQRPSVNVITGLIKANMPSRIAFAVTSGVDSRTILDSNGAEKLLGKGDMLYYPQNVQKPLRVQGAFVSDWEVADVVEFLKNHNEDSTYNQEVAEKMDAIAVQGSASDGRGETADERDEHFVEAAKLLIDKDKGSIGMIQRYFKVGFNRAARIMDQLEEAGVVGPEEGTKPRQILMSEEQLQQYIEEYL